jgi:hypothetical protein
MKTTLPAQVLAVNLLLLVSPSSVTGLEFAARATLAQSVENASTIVEAAVESQTSAWHSDKWGKHIYTTYTLQVRRAAKGAVAGSTISLPVMGGTIADVTEEVSPGWRFPVGQEFVFFLKGDEEGIPRLHRADWVRDGKVTTKAGEMPVDAYVGLLERAAKDPMMELLMELPAVVTSERAKAASSAGTAEVAAPTIGAGSTLPLAPASAPPQVEGRGLGAAAPMSRARPAAVTATIADTRWTDTVDRNANGFASSARLRWAPEVPGGSLRIFEVGYWKYSSEPTSSYRAFARGAVRTVTGTGPGEAGYWEVQFHGPPTTYDFAIAIFQEGAAVPDHVREPSKVADLWLVRGEGAEYDAPPPVITSMTPAKTSAGTGTAVTISGTDFGLSQGTGRVDFFVLAGEPTIPAVIRSWSDTQIVCEVPVGTVQLNEGGTYFGSASSGPVTVTTDAGKTSPGYAFRVSFGYGQRLWGGTNPTVPYYVGENLPVDSASAVQSAGLTWSSSAGIRFIAMGTTGHNALSNNGLNEVMLGTPPPTVPPDVGGVADCWDAFGVITECDFLLNSGLSWSTSASTPIGSYDVETIALHGIGHWLSLLDLHGSVDAENDSAKVMYGFNSGGPGGMKRSLHADDIAGAQWIYGPPAACSYSLSPSQQSFPSSGGTGSVSVTAGDGCPWSAGSNADWITITGGASGTGNGTVSYSVAANTSVARAGTLTIADQTFTVSQAATGCSYSINPTQQAFGYAGGTGSVSVTTDPNCSWTATSNASWVTITGGASGTGNGTVSYSVAANTSVARSGTLTIAGQTFTVNQAALNCSYSISPSSTSIAAAGGTGSVAVTASAGCSWTAASNAAWISITSGASGSGSGSVGYSVSANTDGARTGTLTIAGQTFTVSQAGPGCSYSINPTQTAFGYRGGTGSTGLTAGPTCSWTATSNASWITIIGGASGTGNGTVSYSVAANSGGARSGTLTIAGLTFTVNQDAFTCSYSINPTQQAFGFAGGTGSVSLTTGPTCSWTATSNAGWITFIGGAGGTGNGTVSYSVAANTGGARTGTLTIAGQAFTVSQAGPSCSYSINPTQQAIGFAGGPGSVSVTTGPTCSWTATSNAGWITVTGGASGTGNGTVSYSVAANSGGARSGTLTIGGQTFTVNQDGFNCSYSISPTQKSFASSGGAGSVAVTASPTCSWTATSGAGWITVTGGASGTGNGTVSYSVAANTSGARSGIVTIAGQTFTVNQDGFTCSYSIAPVQQSFTSSGGVGAVAVTASPACSWTATSNASWVAITSGASGSGIGSVEYSVAGNSAAARSGSMTIAGQTFTVNQDAGQGCSYSISPLSVHFDQRGGTGSFGVTSPWACSWTGTSDSSWLRVTGVSGAGNGLVAFSVDANSGARRTGHITVQSQIFTVRQASGTGILDLSHWLGAISHVDGLNDSHWRSDVAVLNRSSLPATVEFRLYSPDGVLSKQVTVSGNAQAFQRDVAAWLGYSAGSGSLEVRSDQDVFVMGRTYNQVDATHTYGQNYDGQDPTSALLSAGQSAWLPLLAQDVDFRCNIAITNTGTTTASVTLTLYDGQGNQLWSGSDESNALPPGGFVQYLTPFQKYAGRNDIEQGYAMVTVSAGSGIIAWASVVDENTGDPTTIFMQR